MNEQLLRDLATQLGTTTEYLWRIMVQGQRMRALGYGLDFLLLAGAVGLGVWAFRWSLANFRARRLVVEAKYAGYDLVGAIWAVWASAILTMVVLMFASNQLYWAVACWVAPEYSALRQLIELIQAGRR